MTKAEKIVEARRNDACPNCGEQLGRTPAEGRRTGTGSVADGVFCSTKCLWDFHARETDDGPRLGNWSELGSTSRN